MKRLFPIGLLLVFLTACQQKERLYTKDEMQRIMDSSVQIQMQSVQQMVEDDLDKRSAIEVKPLADSIVQAKSH